MDRTQEMELAREHSQIAEKYNKRMYNVCMALILAVVLLALSFVGTCKIMSDNFTDASKAYWHDYMYSDYDYGSYEINQEVRVNE